MGSWRWVAPVPIKEYSYRACIWVLDSERRESRDMSCAETGGVLLTVDVASLSRRAYNLARLFDRASSGPARGPPEAPCAAQQCVNGAPAPLVSVSTDFPIKYG